MYSVAMYLDTAEVSRAPTSHLDRDDWVKAAWDVFVSGGISAVTIKSVAETLDVTRGSFYHHFLDRADLLRELLRYWERECTIRIRIFLPLAAACFGKDHPSAIAMSPRNRSTAWMVTGASTCDRLQAVSQG